LVEWGTQDAWALTASPSPQHGGATPLQLALKNQKEEVVKVLREAGAIGSSERGESWDGRFWSSESGETED